MLNVHRSSDGCKVADSPKVAHSMAADSPKGAHGVAADSQLHALLTITHPHKKKGLRAPILVYHAFACKHAATDLRTKPSREWQGLTLTLLIVPSRNPVFKQTIRWCALVNLILLHPALLDFADRAKGAGLTLV